MPFEGAIVAADDLRGFIEGCLPALKAQLYGLSIAEPFQIEVLQIMFVVSKVTIVSIGMTKPKASDPYLCDPPPFRTLWPGTDTYCPVFPVDTPL